jgi:flagellar basal-body rod protein FlgF
MDNAAYVALSRLSAQSRAMDVTAGNIANANTTGYKAERVLFSDWLARQRNTTAPAGGNTIAYTQDRATYRNQQEGGLTHTGNPLDLAISGDGFFTVETAHGPRLTRAGRFDLTSDGTIADAAGNALLDTNGRPLQLSPTDTSITVAGDGTVSTANGEIGRIGVMSADDPMRLQSEGGQLARTDGTTSAIAAPKLIQGALEESNVQPVLELTRMTSDLREFQFMSQFVRGEADRHQSAIDKILPPKS